MPTIAHRAKNVIAKEGVIITGFARKAIRKSKEYLTGRYDLNSAYDGDFFSFKIAPRTEAARCLAPRCGSIPERFKPSSSTGSLGLHIVTILEYPATLALLAGKIR
jgi:hypothetical protein